ncbi:hypothetical protein J2W48_001219 [Flavobacterium piscis]|uniref:Uncharacterized protein n=1 Tax=Flavobacterium piscis TaxID=1114874 RepID=A0ABU1Y4Y3_9FLAO|nr:hypothetical protein [Flavobacterium piscis]
MFKLLVSGFFMLRNEFEKFYFEEKQNPLLNLTSKLFYKGNS